METRHCAIAAAALRTCQLLYEEGKSYTSPDLYLSLLPSGLPSSCSPTAGELDSNLMPIGKDYLRYMQQEAAWAKEAPARAGRGLPGTAKRKQCYRKKVCCSSS